MGAASANVSGCEPRTEILNTTPVADILNLVFWVSGTVRCNCPSSLVYGLLFWHSELADSPAAFRFQLAVKLTEGCKDHILKANIRSSGWAPSCNATYTWSLYSQERNRLEELNFATNGIWTFWAGPRTIVPAEERDSNVIAYTTRKATLKWEEEMCVWGKSRPLFKSWSLLIVSVILSKFSSSPEWCREAVSWPGISVGIGRGTS